VQNLPRNVMQNSSRPWSDRRMAFYFTPLTLPWTMERINYCSYVWIRERSGVWMPTRRRRSMQRGKICIIIFWGRSCPSWHNVGVWRRTRWLRQMPHITSHLRDDNSVNEPFADCVQTKITTTDRIIHSLTWKSSRFSLTSNNKPSVTMDHI